MDKLVYLYELDSVHNSPEEILRGQQALFEEIVLSGNQVVLTFNQLTDSQAFLCAVRDLESYPHILELFRLGALKISRFAPRRPGETPDEEREEQLRGQVRECRRSDQYKALFESGVLKSYPPLPADAPQRVLRTASHYIQNAVEKCLNDDNDSFLFSALPFRSQDKKILSALSYALQYSDPSVLDTCPEAFRFPEEDGPDGERKARERQDYVKRYVEMILQLSREPLASNPEKTGASVSFAEMMDRILRVCGGLSSEPEDETAQLLPQALERLKELRQTAFGPEKPVNNRSNWYKELKEYGKEPAVLLAEAVVDLCYNYTMEASITGAARHYRDDDDASFREDFLCRLRLYWEDGRRGIHQFQRGDRRELSVPVPKKMPPWGTAVRLLRSVPEGRKEQTGGPGETLYESVSGWGKRGWYGRIVCSLLKQFFTTVAYFFIFLCSSVVLDQLETKDPLSWITALLRMGEPYRTALNILLFGILGSTVSLLFGLPDILNNTKAFITTLWDGARLLLVPRHVAYSRSAGPREGKEGLR